MAPAVVYRYRSSYQGCEQCRAVPARADSFFSIVVGGPGPLLDVEGRQLHETFAGIAYLFGGLACGPA